jgi:hypothetical protein
MKRCLSLGIVAFWLVMVVLFVRRHLSAHQPPLTSSWLPVVSTSPAVQDGQDDWMGIYHYHTKIGYFHRRLTPTATGYQWEEQSRMQLRVLDTPQTLHTEMRAHIDRHYTLQDFSFRLRSAGTVFHITGEVARRGAASHELRGQISSGGHVSPFALPLREPIYLPTIAPLTLRGAALAPGAQRQFRIFNPLVGKTDIISLTVIGPETLWLDGTAQTVTKVAERFHGTTVHAWLDQEGRVVKEEAALGLVMLRERKEAALGERWQESTPLDLVAAAAIPIQSRLPEPRTLTYLRLRLSGPDAAALFAFPPRQQLQDGVLTVVAEDITALASYPLPQTNPEFALDLEATPFMQSSHTRLMAQARQILGAERDAIQAARLLLDWTYTSLAKTPAVGMPTALDVLTTRKGDCNEHAVLFTALARAAGLPARVVAGVVYINDAFYYHAWAEVWLGQWVAVDPTLHQFPADATHVKFVEGGPEQHTLLLSVIGQLNIEVVEYQ